MRKRKFLVGAVLGVTAVFAFSSVASAQVVNQTYSSVATKTKQDKKVRGPVGPFITNVDTTYGAQFFPGGSQTVLTFDTAFKLGDQGSGKTKLAQCNLADIVGQTAAGARAACGDALIGQGGAVNRTKGSGAQTLPGTVSAFNGEPSGGKPTLYLHVDIQGSTTKPILTGTLTGNTLTVLIPPVPTVITHFDTTINQVKVAKANKKTGKPARYYVSAKCNDGSWDHTETTTFENGTAFTAASPPQECQKKASSGGKK